jgi:hypothetical protein
MAGDEGDGRGVLSMGQGDAGVSRGGNGRGDAWHDFKRDARLDQYFRLLAPAAKYKGVASLQAGNSRTRRCLCDDQGVDPVL